MLKNSKVGQTGNFWNLLCLYVYHYFSYSSHFFMVMFLFTNIINVKKDSLIV